MALYSRRRFLASGVAAGASTLAGCGFLTTGGEQCTEQRDRHESDVDLPGSAAWPGYQYDRGNTGHNPSASGPAGEPTVAWRASLCGGTTAAVVRDGRAHVGGFVFDARTGELVGGEVHGHVSAPAVLDGTAYVSTHDLEARDAASGERLWTFETDEDAGGLPAPTVVDGTAYVSGGIDDPTLYAVDAAEGTERWRFETGGDVDTPAAVVDGTVYVADGSQTLYAVDAAEGTERWRRALDPRVWLSGPVVADGAVYLGSLEGEVLAFETADGSTRWRRRVEDGQFEVRDPVAVADGTVHAASASGTIAALDAATGDVEWHVDADADGLGAPAVADGVVYVGARSSTPLFALDAATGEEQWRFETREDRTGDAPSDGIAGAPAVVDGAVYVATLAGDLYALVDEG